MKKLVCLLMVVLLTFSFTACGSKSASQDNNASPTTKSENKDQADRKFKIAVVAGEASNPWYVRTAQGVAQYAKDSGNEAFQKAPDKADAAAQVQVIEDVIAQGIDALCVIPVTPEALEPVLKKARDKGIVVIAQEGATVQNIDYDIEAFVPKQYGAFIMDNLAELMGKKGKYVCMVSFLTASSHNEWADAGIARAKEMYPEMELIPEEKLESQDNQEVAYERAKEILKKYPDLKGIFGTSSFDAPGAAKAIEELGLKGKVFTVGTTVVSLARKFFENGSMQAATLWDPALSTYAQCVLAEQILKGEEIKEGINLRAPGYESMKFDSTGKVLMGDAQIVLTKENMDEYDF